MWSKTHRALKDFYDYLKCPKCKKPLAYPKQFLNCGHIICAKCLGSNTNCLECGIPSTLAEIQDDQFLNSMMNDLDKISDLVKYANKPKRSSIANFQTELPAPTETSSICSGTKKRLVGSKKVESNVEDNQTLISDSSCTRSTVVGSKKSKNIAKNLPASSESETSNLTQKGSRGRKKDINKANYQGETLLHINSKSNKIDKVRELLKQGANPNTKDYTGWTPLIEAVSFQNTEIVEMLLNAGADPNIKGIECRTALHEAVQVNNAELVKILLKNKADPEIKDQSGNKPIDICRSDEIDNILQNIELYNEPSVSEKNFDVNPSFQQATLGTNYVFYGSALKKDDLDCLKDIAKRFKIKLAPNLDDSVTHVFIQAMHYTIEKISWDILFTILSGKWLISNHCIQILDSIKDIKEADSAFEIFEIQPSDEAVKSGNTLARENRAKLNPSLFKGCHFFLDIPNKEEINYDEMLLTKFNLIKLVKAGDGVILGREPRFEDSANLPPPHHLLNKEDHPLYRCTHFIIYVPAIRKSSNKEKIIYNSATLKSLPLKWFIESITKFELLDPAEVGADNSFTNQI